MGHYILLYIPDLNWTKSLQHPYNSTSSLLYKLILHKAEIYDKYTTHTATEMPSLLVSCPRTPTEETKTL